MSNLKQDLFDYIEISKDSGVPILLLSSPGYGKTTSINEYAELYGYNVETLIGSRFTPEEIMGYMVNEPGSDVLVQKDPVWFRRVTNSDKPTILFIDELSTCSEKVQGSLLSLIFDRKIGNGKALPKDCVMIAAANYSENLPGFFDIMAPTINRFCVINYLENYNNIDVVKEFLKAPKPAQKRELFEIDENEFYENFAKTFEQLIVKYSISGSSLGYLDFQNADFADLYKREGKVYNVASGRSMYYLKLVAATMAKLRINDLQFIKKITGGLVGLGTNNFKSDEQITTWIDNVAKAIQSLINSTKALAEEKYNFDDLVSEEISKYFTKRENKNEATNFIVYEEKLVDYIEDTMGDAVENYETLKSGNGKFDIYEFEAAMTSIMQLLKMSTSQENQKRLAGIHQSNIAVLNSLYKDCKEYSFADFNYGIFAPTVFTSCGLYYDENDVLGNYGTIGSGTSSVKSNLKGKAPFKATCSKIAKNLKEVEKISN